MTFFTPTSPFTHYARFVGIPCYFNVNDDSIAGTNIIFDWLVLHVCPFLANIQSSIIKWWTAEECGFMIELRGVITHGPHDIYREVP